MGCCMMFRNYYHCHLIDSSKGSQSIFINTCKKYNINIMAQSGTTVIVSAYPNDIRVLSNYCDDISLLDINSYGIMI